MLTTDIVKIIERCEAGEWNYRITYNSNPDKFTYLIGSEPGTLVSGYMVTLSQDSVLIDTADVDLITAANRAVRMLDYLKVDSVFEARNEYEILEVAASLADQGAKIIFTDEEETSE